LRFVLSSWPSRFGKLLLRFDQTPLQLNLAMLLNHVIEGRIDTAWRIRRHMGLEDAPTTYKMFKERQNEVAKVVLRPP